MRFFGSAENGLPTAFAHCTVLAYSDHSIVAAYYCGLEQEPTMLVVVVQELASSHPPEIFTKYDDVDDFMYLKHVKSF
jgi:hypothetical protein